MKRSDSLKCVAWTVAATVVTSFASHPASGQDTCGFDILPHAGLDLAADGEWLALGEPGDPENPALVYLFKWDGVAWIERPPILASDLTSNPQSFAESVAMSGQTLAVAERYADRLGENSGAAYVFRLEGDAWVFEQELLPPDYGLGDQYFGPVAVDGDVVAVGAYGYSSSVPRGRGAVYVFRRNTSGVWQFEARLSADDADHFGVAVAMKGDTIIGLGVNAPSLIFERIGTTWIETYRFASGWRVGFDGQRAVVDLQGTNAFTILARTAEGWSEEATIAPEHQVGRVAISGDTVLIGAPGYGDTTVYVRHGGQWGRGVAIKNPVPESGFGWPVGFVRGRLAVGARYDADELFLFDGIGYPDCNANSVRDGCEALDCDGDGVPNDCEITAGAPDCNGNALPDNCDVALADCNQNGTPDDCDPDCDGNGVADDCESIFTDCNANQILDECDISTGTSEDCNSDGVPDECEPFHDCNLNGIRDSCDIRYGTSADCDGNGVPDECPGGGGPAPYPDCNHNGVLDSCDIQRGVSWDCDRSGIPDECENDCNNNRREDACDISLGLSQDCDGNGIPDECEVDCNGNHVLDVCEIADGVAEDCDGNGVPDECDPDCNRNDVVDACETADGSSPDCDGNGVPDECDPDCDFDGTPDACELAAGTAVDSDGDGLPDKCEGKNRAISFSPDQAGAVAGGLQTAVRVTLLDVAGFESFNGEVRWVGPPAEYSEDTSPPMPDFVAATLQCCPYFRDWSGTALSAEFGGDTDVSQVHIVGASIVPGSDYVLQAVDSSCLDLLDEGCYSAAIPVGTARFGDVWEQFGTAGQPNFIDISKVVEKFKGVPFDHGPPPSGAPIKVRAMLRGRIPPLAQKVNFMDIGAAVAAFKTLPYPELGPIECTDPCE